VPCRVRVKLGKRKGPASHPPPRRDGATRKGATLFKRILLTAVIGGGLLFGGSAVAYANSRGSHHAARHDHGGDRGDYVAGYWGPGVYYGPYASPYVAPRLTFRGFDRAPGFYYAPPGIGAPSAGFYLPYLTDFYGDDYFVSYGFRCNGYRDGYYYDHGGRRLSSYRHNADCDDYYVRHGNWYGVPVCDAYDADTGYCSD
jgi:hypothetical protein